MDCQPSVPDDVLYVSPSFAMLARYSMDESPQAPLVPPSPRRPMSPQTDCKLPLILFPYCESSPLYSMPLEPWILSVRDSGLADKWEVAEMVYEKKTGWPQHERVRIKVQQRTGSLSRWLVVERVAGGWLQLKVPVLNKFIVPAKNLVTPWVAGPKGDGPFRMLERATFASAEHQRLRFALGSLADILSYVQRRCPDRAAGAAQSFWFSATVWDVAVTRHRGAVADSDDLKHRGRFLSIFGTSHFHDLSREDVFDYIVKELWAVREEIEKSRRQETTKESPRLPLPFGAALLSEKAFD